MIPPHPMKRSPFLSRGAPLERRTPLDRGKPIERSAPMKRKRARRCAKTDYAFLARVRRLPCGARGLPGATPCRGRMTASHYGEGGTGKQHGGPNDVGPLCWGHHLLEWERFTGTFAGWGNERRRAWGAAQVAAARAAVGPCRDEAQAAA